MPEERLLLVGCGILRKEINLLIEKNGWPLDTYFVDSSLHVDFNRLSKALTGALEKHRDRKTIVFYGCCHPLMDNMLEKAGTFRTPGQNCIEILLGKKLFDEELEKGAFFLLEDWALRWDRIIMETFGNRDDIVREIFHVDRKYLLCLKTPVSGDFSAEAVEAGSKVGLPLRWMDVSLGHLESVLKETLTRKMGETP